MSREPVKPIEMNRLRIRARWFQITGILIVFQFLLGGLVSNNVINPLYHIVLGFVVLAIVLATMVVAIFSKPSLRSLKLGSVLLVVLLVLQVPLGFALLDSDTPLLSFVHIANAIAILLTAFVSYFVARGWEKKSVLKV